MTSPRPATPTRPDPAWLRPLLTFLVLLGAVGYGFAAVAGNHHKIFLRSACLLLATTPAFALSWGGRRATGVLRTCIAAALMTYLVASGRIDLEALRRGLAAWPWLIAGAVLVLNQPFLAALRWQWLLHGQGIQLGYLPCLRLVFAGFFFNFCLPGATGGDIFRAYAVTVQSGRTAEAVTTVVIDRLSGLAALVFLAAAALLCNIPFIRSTPAMHRVAALMGALLCGGVLLLMLLFSRTCYRILRRSPLGEWRFPGRQAMGRAYRSLHTYRGSPAILFAAVGTSLCSHLGTIAGAYCFGQAMSLTGLEFVQYLLLVPLGLCFNAIPITPGGVGQGQTAFAYLFHLALPGVGGAGALGAAVMTLLHLALFVAALAGGLIYAVGYHQLHAAVEEAERFSAEDSDAQ